MMKRILITVYLLFVLFGCGTTEQGWKKQVEKADFFASQGKEYIKKSVSLYEGFLGKDIGSQSKEEVKIKLGELYLEIGRYDKSIECFKNIQSPEIKKNLAIAYYKNAQYSDALALFERLQERKDGEYLFYYGQVLEKHNLYDKALEMYSLITKENNYFSQAKSRIQGINLSEGTLSDKDIKDLLENTPEQEDYPEAGAVVLLADETFEVFDDNTAEFDFHFMVKIFNERGKQEFSELKIGYDSTFEDVELEYARTITSDGRVVYVGDKHIRDVSLYLNFPLYSNARVRIISMPEVANGSIIEYKAKKRRKQLVNKKDFIINYYVQESEPIKEAKFYLKIPQDRQINYKLLNTQYNTFNAELHPKESVVDGKKLYSWELKDIPEIIPEPGMPPAARINPIFMVSSFADWNDVYKWWYELYKDKIEINDEIKEKVNELVKDKNSQEDKARAIAHFCAKDIRYVVVEYGTAGYEPHSAIDIFKNRYGDCKDQAILLIGMLRSIGVEAYPVLIPTYGSIDMQKDFPGITFNHAIAVARLDEEWIFMDPTGQTISFKGLPSGDQDRDVFAVLDNEYKILTTPLFPSEDNMSAITMNIAIDKNEKLYAKREVKTKGAFLYGQRYWLQFTKPKLIEESLLNTANSFAAGAHLENYNISNVDDMDKDLLLEYEFSAPQFLIEAKPDRLIPRLGDINISPVVREERIYPIESSILIEVKDVMQIEIPKHLKIKYLPKDITIDSSWFDYINSYELKENTVVFTQIYKRKKRLISLDEYFEYKTLLEDISVQTNQHIILKER